MKTSVRRNPLLAEVLINLLFFTVCACIIISVFVSAYMQSKDTNAKQEALLHAEYIAEEFKSSDKTPGEFFSALEWTQGEEFSHLTESGFTYRADYINGKPHISGFRLTVSEGEEQQFAFDVEVFRP